MRGKGEGGLNLVSYIQERTEADCEKWIFTKVIGPEMKQQEERANFIIRRFMICTPHQFILIN